MKSPLHFSDEFKMIDCNVFCDLIRGVILMKKAIVIGITAVLCLVPIHAIGAETGWYETQYELEAATGSYMSEVPGCGDLHLPTRVYYQETSRYTLNGYCYTICVGHDCTVTANGYTTIVPRSDQRQKVDALAVGIRKYNSNGTEKTPRPSVTSKNNVSGISVQANDKDSIKYKAHIGARLGNINTSLIMDCN